MSNAEIATRWRRRARLIAWRCRFVLAAACCALAALAGIAAVRPAGPATEPVVVTTRAVDAGQTLGKGDVTVRRLPRGSAPAEAISSTDRAVSRTVAVRLPAGMPLTPGVIGGDTPAAPPGRVLVPVRLDAAVAALLEPGVRVDLLAPVGAGEADAAAAAAADTVAAGQADGVGAAGDGASADADSAAGARSSPFLARSALVIASPGTEESSDARVVLVAVTAEEGIALARVGQAILATVLVP